MSQERDELFPVRRSCEVIGMYRSREKHTTFTTKLCPLKTNTDQERNKSRCMIMLPFEQH